MQYLQRSTKQEVQRNWQSYFTLCGEKKPSLKNSRMQQLSTYSKGKEILKSVTIIEASLYCQLLGRSLLGSYCIDWINTLNSQGFYQKASVDSWKQEEQQTWSLQHDNFKTNARNRMWTYTWPLSTLSKHLTQSVVRDFGKSWQRFGCPAKVIAMVRQFHDGMLARVQKDDEFSDRFPLTNGVKQGCVLASTLFSMMLSAMLTDAFQDGDNGIPIKYRFDGKLFNLARRLQAKSKVQTEVLDEFLFADDMAKDAPSEEKMQKGVDQVSDSCDSYNLTISIKNTTEVVYLPTPGKPYKESSITVKGQRLQVVDKFTYLGSTLPRVVHIDDEVNARFAKASAAFGLLRGSIWDRSGIRFDTKLKVYRSVVLPTL